MEEYGNLNDSTEVINKKLDTININGNGDKFLSDNGLYISIDNRLDITTIYNELAQQAEVGGVASDDTYNKLLNYNKNGYNLYIVQDGYRINITSIVSDGDILLSYSVPYFDVGELLQVISISGSNKNVSVVQNLLPSNIGVPNVKLEEYSKAGSYSAITSTDSIKNAIAKLEAGIEGSSGGNIYYLSKKVLQLSYNSTSEEIYAAFENENIGKDIYDAIKSGKIIAIKSDFSIIPCYVFSFASAITYLSFIYPLSAGVELWYLVVSKSSSRIEILNPKGYAISNKINTLTSESTSADIENALGGFEGIKKLEKAVADGNNIYTTYQAAGIQSRLQLSVVVGGDDSTYSLMITGTSGDGYMSLSPIGILLITYEVGSNTYSCLRYILKVDGV